MVASSFDLGELSAALNKEKRHPDLQRAVRDCLGLRSCEVDLDQAHIAMALLDDLDSQRALIPQEDADAHFAMALQGKALFTLALTLYTRVTHSRSDHRNLLKRRSIYSEAQRSAHDMLTSLRDEGVMHYGPGRTGRGEKFNDDRLIITGNEECFELDIWRRRVDYRGADVIALNDLCVTLLENVQDQIRDADGRLAGILDSLADDADVMRLLPECRVIPPSISDGKTEWCEWARRPADDERQD